MRLLRKNKNKYTLHSESDFNYSADKKSRSTIDCEKKMIIVEGDEFKFKDIKAFVLYPWTFISSGDDFDTFGLGFMLKDNECSFHNSLDLIISQADALQSIKNSPAEYVEKKGMIRLFLSEAHPSIREKTIYLGDHSSYIMVLQTLYVLLNFLKIPLIDLSHDNFQINNSQDLAQRIDCEKNREHNFFKDFYDFIFFISEEYDTFSLTIQKKSKIFIFLGVVTILLLVGFFLYRIQFSAVFIIVPFLVEAISSSNVNKGIPKKYACIISDSGILFIRDSYKKTISFKNLQKLILHKKSTDNQLAFIYEGGEEVIILPFNIKSCRHIVTRLTCFLKEKMNYDLPFKEI